MLQRYLYGAVVLGLLAIWPGTPALQAAPKLDEGFRPGALAIQNVVLVDSRGETGPRVSVVIRSGMIEAVGENLKIPADAQVLDLAGHLLYPGFIDAANSVLLTATEVPQSTHKPFDVERLALSTTREDNHHLLSPHLDVASRFRPTVKDLDVWRQNGFCVANLVPSGRIAPGQSALVDLSGDVLTNCRLSSQPYVAFTFAEGPGGGERRYPATLMGQFAHVRQKFHDAQRLDWLRELQSESVRPAAVPKLDAVLETFIQLKRRLLKGLIFADTRDELERAIRFAQEHRIDLTIAGASEAWEQADALKAAGVGLMVSTDWGDEPKIEATPEDQELVVEAKAPVRWQEYKQQQWKKRISGLATLRDSQRFALTSRGQKSAGDFLKSIRTGIAQGWKVESALECLTTEAARQLDIPQGGRIEAGAPAYLTIWTGKFSDEKAKVRYCIVRNEVYEYHTDAKPIPQDVSPAVKKDAELPLVQGTWQMTFPENQGGWKATVEIQQQKDQLSGRFMSEQGDGKIPSGKVTFEGLEFDVSIGAGDRSINLKLKGKFTSRDPLTLEGTLSSPFGGESKWKGTKTATASNPVQLTGIDAGAPETKAGTATVKPSGKTLPVELPEDRRTFREPQTGEVLIKAGVILTGEGTELRNSRILIRKGRIADIRPDIEVGPNTRVIDASDRYVMPGMIDTHSHIMISVSGSGSALSGVNEATDSIVCEVRIEDVVSTNDPAEYRAAAGGLTTARLLHGSANTIGGQHAVVHIQPGASIEGHRVVAPPGVKFALGENVKFRTDRFPNTRLGVEATLQRAFSEALAYRREWQEFAAASKKFPQLQSYKPLGHWSEDQFGTSSDEDPRSEICSALSPANRWLPPRRDTRLDALVEILNGQLFVHSHCYRADEILMLLRLAEKFGFRVRSLQHVLEGYKLAPEIVAHGASSSTFSDWWAYKVEAYDATPYNAALMHYAGGNSVIKSDDHELIRHMNLEAAKSVRYGNLMPQVALQLVTRNAARELGIEQDYGTIAVGKWANLALFNGHPLSSFSRCEMTIVHGTIVFEREKQPTVMTETGRKQTAGVRRWEPRPSTERLGTVRFPEAVKVLVLQGGDIYPIDGEPIKNGNLVVSHGRIQSVGDRASIPEGATIVDVSGLQIYPGLIDAGCTVGLGEIGKVTETNDFREGGLFQPDLKAATAVNPDSELIRVTRAGGVTTAFTRPTSGIISGQGSLIRMGGWTSEELTIRAEAGLQVSWPKGNDITSQLQELRGWFARARVYEALAVLNAPERVIDPRYEALRPYVRGEKPVVIEAESRNEIAGALKFAEKENLKIVIAGGTDAWMLVDELKKRNVPVIVGPVMRAPLAEYQPLDASYANPGRLHEAGVKFCIRSNHGANARNVPFEAGYAVAYGLPEVAALRAVTLSSAEILGIANDYGSLTPGKVADILITDGSPLEPTTQIKGVLLRGEPQSLETRQTELAKKYLRRYADKVPANTVP